MSRRATTAIENLIFRHRPLVIGVFALVTLLLGHAATGLRIDAGFAKHLPEGHPYMETFREYRDAFGGANRLLIAVRARDGDIFDAVFLTTLERLTDAVFFLPGVDRSSVHSLFTPNVRFIEIVEGGFVGGRVVPADFRPTPEHIARVRENVLKAEIVGRLVADDFSAVMVSAELLERDPASGAPLDHVEVARRLEERIRAPFTDAAVDVHIIGFAKLVGDIVAGASGVLAFFAVAFAITGGLVHVFMRSWQLTALALACALIAVVWTLGLLTVLGFGLDPMSILLPFLVFAIGVSHGVQMINAVRPGLVAGAEAADAARAAFRRLLVPGGVALASDTAGFLTILLVPIPVVRELAIAAALGVLVLIPTSLVLLPVLLSYLRLDRRSGRRPAAGTGPLDVVWRALSGCARRKPAAGVLVAATVLLALGLAAAKDLEIGDLQAGVPELRPESRYNRDVAVITERFAIGVDVLQVIVESVPDGCVDHAVMAAIDRFAWHMTNLPGVQSTRSLPEVARVINAGWNEASLKWRVLPRDPRLLAQAVAPVETASGLLNQDCSAMPVMIFTEDHRARTIARIVAAVKAHAAANDGERHSFRLATGNLGVMAATNEVVAAARVPMLVWIYLAIVGLCLLGFRSLRATVCVVLPLALVSVLVYALMSLLGIGLKVATLPVAALGVGIGVDYGIYVFARLRALLDAGRPLADAWHETLRDTGSAVLLTGLTLATGVATWVLSPLQFQADMGLLLTFVFLANMLGALVLLPALASVLYRSARMP